MTAAHAQSEAAASEYRGGFGFHPLCCYRNETAERLAAIRRADNVDAIDADEHFWVRQIDPEQAPEADLDSEIFGRAPAARGAIRAVTADRR